MFNQSNVANRLRHIVRGRVMVFTTSLKVEFLEESLQCSYPLYSAALPYPPDRGLSFMVELNGYLTFDPGSQVKIVELAPYERGFFDPTFFVVVAPADPFTPRILSVGNFAAVTAGGDILYFCVEYGLSDGSSGYDYLKLKPGFHVTVDQVRALPELQPGRPYLGFNGYSQFMQN